MSLTRYRGAHLTRHGVTGVVLVVCVIALGLQAEQFIAWSTTVRYTAVFAEAGGLGVGDEVVLSGVTVGTVTRLSLDHGDARVDFRVRDRITLGGGTSAHIKTGSLLGRRVLTLAPAGPGTLRPGEVIPIERTSSPYSLTDAVGELAATVGETDTAALDPALDTLATTLDRVAPQLGPAFDGLTELSRTINSRDETLRALLTATADVSGILAESAAQLNTLILDANALLQTLVARRQAIVDLLAGTAAVAEQLRALVADNEAELAPTLDRLNSVVAMLEDNRDNIAAALPGLAKVAMTQGEAVSGGPFYNAFVANLIPGDLIQPFIDQAFGVPNPLQEPPR
ncbi:MAG TPA: MCE family protein [Nocardia sp.]|uniref:MCE family protein n=1 Tax=Nocardia sp. TaxID=1821 RepID=UPI002B4B57C7|nr:MCE family protein [Nocardia sp.]HLS76019.1 MCE family protein [Nocardia sp.]